VLGNLISVVLFQVPRYFTMLGQYVSSGHRP
jgi:hypothetical protein